MEKERIQLNPVRIFLKKSQVHKFKILSVKIRQLTSGAARKGKRFRVQFIRVVKKILSSALPYFHEKAVHESLKHRIQNEYQHLL